MTLDDLRAVATNTRNDFACWPAPYQMSVTLEDAEFLYALVRVTKPGRVLELGTGLGVSGFFIASALEANGPGSWLLTVESNAEYRWAAKELLDDLPVRAYADASGPGLEEAVDLVFIDSGYERRPSDIDEWLGGDFDGLVVVHDANRQYPGLQQGVGVFLPGSDGLWIGRARA